MSKTKLDWTLFEKAAAAVKAVSEPPSVGKPGDPNSGGTKSPFHHSNDPGLMFRQGRTNSPSHYSNQPQPKKPAQQQLPAWLRRAGVRRHSGGGIQVGNSWFHNPFRRSAGHNSPGPSN